MYDKNDPKLKGCVITGSVASQTQGQDENVNLRDNKFVNNSGVFKGWSVGKDAYTYSVRNGKYRQYIHPEQYETNYIKMQDELYNYRYREKNVEETIVQN